MAFAEDLAPFLSESAFAVSATLGAATFSVIFDRAHIESLGISSAQPVCVGKTSDLSGAAFGGTITIAGAAYTVRDNQPDGTGITTLLLEAA